MSFSLNYLGINRFSWLLQNLTFLLTQSNSRLYFAAVREISFCYWSRAGESSLSWQLLTTILFCCLYNFTRKALDVYLKIYSEIFIRR